MADTTSIYTDPTNMDKDNVQLSIWNGTKWVELSNGLTLNTINSNVSAIADKVAEAQQGIAQATTDAQNAVDTANTAITQAGFANDTATTAKQVADTANSVATQAQSDISTVSSDLDTTKTNLQTVSDLANKNKTDINTTNSTVSGIQTDLANTKGDVTELQTTATGLRTDVTNAQGDISTLKVTATGLESDVATNTGDISSLSNTVSGLSSTVANNNGDITTLKTRADGFDVSVAQLQDSSVSTNLLLGTSNYASLTGTNTANQVMYNYSLANGYNVSKLATIYGTQFTVSFDWSVSGSSPSGNFTTQWNNVPWGISSVATVSSSNTSGHFSKLFGVGTTTANIATMIGFRFDNFVGTITISNVKLEKGSVATDWCLNPSELTTITALSSVKQEADSISTTVTNNKTSSDNQFSTINQTISGIQSTVSNKADSSTVTQLSTLVNSKVNSSDYQSEITQLSSDINLRVKTGDLISQINQQAGGNTLIQVASGKGKLYLDSSTVVFSGNAFIPSANIASISADKISTGTMTAGAINLGNGTFKVDTSGNLTANSATITGGAISINDTFKVDTSGAMKVTDTANQGVYFNMSQMALKTGLTSGGTLFDVAGNISSYDSIPEDLIVTNQSPITSLSFPNSTTSLPSQYYSKFGIIISDSNGNTYNMSTTGISTVSTKSINANAKTELDLTAKNNINISSTSGSVNITAPSDININSTGGTTYLTSTGNHDTIIGNSAGTGNVGMRGAILYWDTKQNGGTRVLYGDINGLQILSGGLQATAGGSHLTNTRIDDELWVNGKLEASSLSVSGSKNSIVKTSQGWALINAYETAEYYFGDIGKTNTGDGSKVKVMIDSLFLETVNTNVDYHVFVSSYGNGYAWISEQGTDYFIIESNVPNLDISYEVKAKRLGYEGNRLEIDKDYDASHENVGAS